MKMEAAFSLTIPELAPWPVALPIVATVSCSNVMIKQLCGQRMRFIITDANNPASPIALKGGDEYFFRKGYAANETVGTLEVFDVPDWPEMHATVFQVLQR
jgi:hypothetical protein